MNRPARRIPAPLSMQEAGKALAALEWSRARHDLSQVRLELEDLELSPGPEELRTLLHAYRSELHNLALAEVIARRLGPR